MRESRDLGVLDIHSIDPNVFNEQEVEILEALATQIVSAVESARLYDLLEDAVRQEHLTADPLDHFLDDGHHAGPVQQWSVAPEQAVLDAETQQLIEAAIATLPEIFRDVYVLADVEGLPNAEIADMLGLSVAAVKSRLHRARLLMRDALAPHFQEVAT